MKSKTIGRASMCMWLLALLLLQADAGFTQEKVQDEKSSTFRYDIRIVTVDMTAHDKSGNSVTDLRADECTVKEGGQEQKITVFERRFSDSNAAAKPAPKLPPNVFTNKILEVSDVPLTIYLLDALNTPAQNQQEMKRDLLQFIERLPEDGRPVMVYGLTRSLIQLQGVTRSRSELKAAVKAFLARTNSLTSGQKTEDRLSMNMARTPDFPAALLASMKRFEDEEISQKSEQQIAITLAALRGLARATHEYPGRKSLVWLSGSIPISFVPDVLEGVNSSVVTPSIELQLLKNYSKEISRTANLLADERIVMYPINVKGIVGASLADATTNGRTGPDGRVPKGNDAAFEISRNENRNVKDQQSMEQLAADTGGRAYFNQNDIESALNSSYKDSQNSYEIAYYPTSKKWNGKFREIKISCNRPGVSLHYRKGYFALDRGKLRDGNSSDAMREALAEVGNSTEIPFVVQLEPVEAKNKNLRLDILVSPLAVTFTPAIEGKQHIEFDFQATAFTRQGQAMNTVGQTVTADLKPESHERILKRGFPFRMEVEDKPEIERVKVLVRDKQSGLIGSVDVVIPRPAQ